MNPTLKSYYVHKSIHSNTLRIHSNYCRRDICNNIILHHCHISALEETRSNHIIRRCHEWTPRCGSRIGKNTFRISIWWC